MKHSKQNAAIVLFAKAPIEGSVKTRLQPHISRENSALLQKAMIEDSIVLMNKIVYAEKYIYFEPVEKKCLFEDIVCGSLFKLSCQKGNDLGEKMYNAFKELFQQGFDKVIIIGVDSPTLPVDYINTAFGELDEAEIVVGPSMDGGYYLIGFKEKAAPVFSGIDWWGSDKVLSQTEELIKKLNLNLSLLPAHYDIDTMEDITFFKTHIGLLKYSGRYFPANTADMLENILK